MRGAKKKKKTLTTQGDDEYNEKIAEWLPFLFDTYNPALVFFQAGVDALKEDSFGRLGMTRGAGWASNHAFVY